MNDLNKIIELINQLPLIDVDKIDFPDYFREEFNKYSKLDDLIIVLKEDMSYLEATAVEAISIVENDKFSSKLKDYSWEFEIEQIDDGIKFLSIYLILSSTDKGRIFLPLNVLRNLDGNYIYFEATVKDENFKSIKVLTRGTLIGRIKNYIKNSFRAT